MSEFTPPTNHEQCRLAAEEIGWLAVGEVIGKYGDGYEEADPYGSGAKVRLAYHNMQHTLRARRDAVAVAQAIGLDEYDQELVRMAASAHDVVHGKELGVAEAESAQWLSGQMERYGFPAGDIEIGRLAVLGTEPVVDQSGAMLGQHVSLQAYPSERARLIAECVTCGDMGALFAPYGPRVGHELYKERQGVDIRGVPSMEQFLEFQNSTLTLLRTYQYPNSVGEQLFGALRHEVLKYQTWLAQQVETGTITEWNQVAEQDELFAARFEDL